MAIDVECAVRIDVFSSVEGAIAGPRPVPWWIDEVLRTGANPPDLAERKRRAESDFADICASNAVWLLVPSAPLTTIGAWVELGYTLQRSLFCKLPILSSGTREALNATVFTSLTEEFENDIDALYRIMNS